ncbi:hypothetical protein SETIT_8G147000v2 [Setaria italica]|uniref:Ubiquitin-like protease family profile domain-containing protein n=1 Tax=Setaria italica TaxID=4555 RepID=A0A368S7Z2_SETIT|nr:hypothetical protein SETIT_8G147000v2 [Setaria italica]
MALWSYEFNIEEAELREKNNNIIKKFALSTVLTLFSPIVEEGHWVLVSVNMFLKEICWFNSLRGSRDTKCFVSAKNLVTNFSKACIQAGVLNKDIFLFDWKYPTDYPHQKSLHDCGLYTMLYMESWNGEKEDITFEPHMIANCRKLAVGIPLLSPRNDILTSKFVEKYCNQK